MRQLHLDLDEVFDAPYLAFYEEMLGTSERADCDRILSILDVPSGAGCGSVLRPRAPCRRAGLAGLRVVGSTSSDFLAERDPKAPPARSSIVRHRRSPHTRRRLMARTVVSVHRLRGGGSDRRMLREALRVSVPEPTRGRNAQPGNDRARVDGHDRYAARTDRGTGSHSTEVRAGSSPASLRADRRRPRESLFRFDCTRRASLSGCSRKRLPGLHALGEEGRRS